ncbi:MAG: CPBP family intramembrane metalloprotease [Muribaculaceae bacterium]|nr:CPBP family intramembrane metalloprotease [Muribaculaceae bacterium]
MNQIIAWNESIHFPAFAAEFETTLRELEDANSSVADAMMEMHTVWEFLITLAVVGLLTGFSEELFFRGSLQHIFIEGHAKKWIAVWGTALIFSAMHFQFFGFVPRVLMGAFFGYLLVWSGSLWPAIFAHVLNNSIVVITMWMSGGEVDNGIDSFGVAVGNAFPLAAVASCIATALFLWGFRNYFFKTKR